MKLPPVALVWGSLQAVIRIVLILVPVLVRADTHIYAGAVGTNVLDPLVFTTGHLYDVSSGFRFPMVLRDRGLNAGYFRGDVLTFTALSSTDLGTGQVPGRALLGSRLAVEVVEALGPEGGSFDFWEGDGENPGNQITFRVPVGTTNGLSFLVISENDGSPGGDAYGHIHGRAFTATLPGLYTVGFRLKDVSTNGPAGGPLHAPSSILRMYFQAGPTIDSLESTPSGLRAYFRSAPGVSNVLEAADSLAAPAWTPIGPGLRGNTTLQWLTDPTPPETGRFYRLRLLSIPP
ncbi:MAG: hypothetical protein ACKPGI_11145 [Verrucomicrobiota bacterium]